MTPRRHLLLVSALLLSALLVTLHNPPKKEVSTLVREGGEHLPPHAPAHRPTLVVSLLIHEDAAWFAEWVSIARAALVDVEHRVVASVSPETYDAYAALGLPGVYFSAPSAKNAWGMDLLRGHVNNLRYAALHFPNFTHAVLAASNNMWIRRLDPEWHGLALPTHGDCGCQCHSSAIRLSTWWHWPKLSYDQVFWDFVQEKRAAVCMGQSEGFLATRQAWAIAVEYIDTLMVHNIPAVSGKNYTDFAYPAEDIYLCTAFCAKNLTKLTVSRNFFEFPDMTPTPALIAAARQDGFLMVKRVPRTPGDPLIGACVDAWRGGVR
jgi:hypothetical protein